tara:strand:- start:184 stop:420 length:237 start_codon:yes stop_codon:yes gene_type:complete
MSRHSSPNKKRGQLIRRVNFRGFLSSTDQRHRQLRERAQRKIKRGMTIWLTSLLAWGLFMGLCIAALILIKLGYISFH